MAEDQRICSIENCDRAARARWLCSRHYQAAFLAGKLTEHSSNISRVVVACPCGTSMNVTITTANRKRYCSKKCLYLYRVLPKGIPHHYATPSPSWFPKGYVPWHKGTKGLEQLTGENNAGWRGDQVGYYALHDWVARHRDKTGKCEHCGTTEKRTEWSNVSFEYRRDLNDWQELCHQCHFQYDRENGWGIATGTFGADRKKPRVIHVP